MDWGEQGSGDAKWEGGGGRGDGISAENGSSSLGRIP